MYEQLKHEIIRELNYTARTEQELAGLLNKYISDIQDAIKELEHEDRIYKKYAGGDYYWLLNHV